MADLCPASERTLREYVSNIEDKDLTALAKIDMNGGKIKNTVKTARLLASQKGAPLAMQHVATVLRVKDGSPVASEPPGRTAGLVHLMLLPFRVLVSVFQELLASIIGRLHRTDVSQKER